MTSRAADLLADARAAAEIRTHQTDPDVVALVVTRASAWIERAIWVAVVVGLAFTAASVHSWYSAGAPVLSPLWWTGWAVTPTVEIIAVAILRGEQILGRYDITPGRRIVAARRCLLAFALTLQLWGPIATLGQPGPGVHGTLGNVVVHAIVIIAVIAGAEAITELRELLNRAITSAAERALADQPAPRPRRSRHRRAAPPAETTDSEPGDSSPADEPTDDPTGPSKGDLALTWIATHWPADDVEPPQPAEIQSGLLAQGVSISRGHACRMRADARAARARDREEQTG